MCKTCFVIDSYFLGILLSLVPALCIKPKLGERYLGSTCFIRQVDS